MSSGVMEMLFVSGARAGFTRRTRGNWALVASLYWSGLMASRSVVFFGCWCVCCIVFSRLASAFFPVVDDGSESIIVSIAAVLALVASAWAAFFGAC